MMLPFSVTFHHAHALGPIKIFGSGKVGTGVYLKMKNVLHVHGGNDLYFSLEGALSNFFYSDQPFFLVKRILVILFRL